MFPKCSIVKSDREFDVDGSTHTLSTIAAIFSDARNVFGFSCFSLWMRMLVENYLKDDFFLS